MWSYSGNPASSLKDKLRFDIGDTDTNDQLLSDEEINYLISEYGNAAAYNACLVLVAKFSKYADKTIGDLSISYSQKVDNFSRLADTFKNKYSSVSGGLANTSTTNKFRTGMMDYK